MAEKITELTEDLELQDKSIIPTDSLTCFARRTRWLKTSTATHNLLNARTKHDGQWKVPQECNRCW
jgi:hypothetical protein